MTENDLINLGFEKVDVSAEESGSETGYYYYALDIGKIGFLSNANDELINGEWVCYLLDFTTFRVFDAKDLGDLIDNIRRNTTEQNN